MKYLIKNGKVEFAGSKQQIIEYVKANYKNEFWIKENSDKFNDDYGVFKFSIEACGFQVTDKIPVSEYNKKIKHYKKR